MRIRRIRLVLPPRMKGGAAQDARRIAEAAATALADGGAVSGPLNIQGGGRNGAALATEVAARIRLAGPSRGRAG